MSTAHLTTASLRALILTWRTQMSSVHSIALASSVEHVRTTSVMFLERLHVGSALVCGHCFGFQSLPKLG